MGNLDGPQTESKVYAVLVRRGPYLEAKAHPIQEYGTIRRE